VMRQETPFGVKNRDSRFVAGGFDAEDVHEFGFCLLDYKGYNYPFLSGPDQPA
jgi:hypothetical protein